MDSTVRRFTEPPPIDYDDVPSVLKWVVKAILHLDYCFDSRLAAIEKKEETAGIRMGLLKTQAWLIAKGAGLGGSLVYVLHLLGKI